MRAGSTGHFAALAFDICHHKTTNIWLAKQVASQRLRAKRMIPDVTEQAGQGRLTYDAVIATRHRIEALALSIPLLLGQSRPPARLIVIDSSDDHAPVVQAVQQACSGWGGELIIEHSAPGLPHQRNCGLRHVTAPVVLFPDDDSLLLPEAAAAIMAIYDRDHEDRIAAVCAGEAMTPPAGMDLKTSDWMSAAHRREAGWRRSRNWLEKRLSVLKPQLYLGGVFAARPVPDWLADLDGVPVEYMTGFRMSFRTAAIRETGFDEALGGYALDEDIDASFSAARSGLVVAARQARIYHHRFPGGRGDGARLGRMEILNRLYIGLKHASHDDVAIEVKTGMRWRLKGFVFVKLLVALSGARSAYGRARMRGAFAAARASAPIWRAHGAHELAAAYRAAFVRAES